jgi:integrase/recombinase XerD
LSTRYDKCSLLRQFSNYLIDLDIESYLPHLPRYQGRNKDVPYIYSNREILEIFKASDELRLMFTGSTGTGLFCFPAIVRFLYATGVRIGEVLSLKNEDVNLIGKYVKIKDGKNHQERLLPISDSLVDVLYTFLWYKKQLILHEKNDFFFTKTDGSKISSELVRKYFKRCLEKVKIYGDDKLRRPRVHDLRHTFAVNALVRIVETGNDAYVALPILSKYLGHRSISSTNMYVKLTSQMFPEVVKNLELYLIDVFPNNN